MRLDDDRQPPEEAGTDNPKQDQRKQWLEENREAINAYNRHVENHKLFSDGLRTF